MIYRLTHIFELYIFYNYIVLLCLYSSLPHPYLSPLCFLCISSCSRDCQYCEQSGSIGGWTGIRDRLPKYWLQATGPHHLVLGRSKAWRRRHRIGKSLLLFHFLMLSITDLDRAESTLNWFRQISQNWFPILNG